MANEEIKSFPMTGGDGPCSYTQNSCFQKETINATKGLISEGIKEKFDLKNPCFYISDAFTVRIADFGCSVGPNTFHAMENIIEAIESKYHSQFLDFPRVPLQLQVFFNDFTSNDFNTLFKNLPSSYQSKYFVAGVPGSFHGRVFPNSTLNVAHCASSLHWLSKVPKEVVDPRSSAWNRDSIYCTGFLEEVSEAYLTQFKNDMEIFLNARAQELVSGGLMVIVMPALPDGVLMSQTSIGMAYDLLGSGLIDMAKSGLISEEKVASFSLPFYLPAVKELEELLERNGCFSIEKIDTMPPRYTSHTLPAQFLSLQLRAVLEELIKRHFGNEIVDLIFENYTEKLSENLISITDKNNKNHADIIIMLKRNAI